MKRGGKSVRILALNKYIYDLDSMDQIIEGKKEDTHNELGQFKRDIYNSYKQIRHICNPRACEKTTLETVKKSLREHWLEHYLNMSLTEAHIVIEYAELFFGLAIK